MSYLYETHMHSSEASACATASAVQQVRAYKARGYAGVILTDHFVNGNTTCPPRLSWEKKMNYFMSGYRRAKAEGDKIGLDVFWGWEYSIRGSDFLTYGLDYDFLLAHPDVDKLDIAAYSALVRKRRGYIAQAHPYRVDSWIASPGPVPPELMDGVEVFNATMPPEVNQKALEFARANGLPMQAGSDCHHIDMPFLSGIIVEKKAESIFDLIEAIKTQKAVLNLP